VRSNKRVRYIAPDGVGGALVTYGPTSFDLEADGLVYRVGPDCTGITSAEIGTMGTAQLGELIPFSPGYWLVASGSNVAGAQRGVFVLQGGSTLEVCGSIGGFEDMWASPGGDTQPYALALTTNGDQFGLAVSAVTAFNISAENQVFGKVLWAELSGTDDPCTMTATVTDLTDGAGDHAPAPNPGDPSTWRRAPNVVVIEEVLGG
jgi:hypothetical protein